MRGGMTDNEEIINKINDINSRLDACCGNYDKAITGIQKVFRGHTSRRNTRRT